MHIIQGSPLAFLQLKPVRLTIQLTLVLIALIFSHAAFSKTTVLVVGDSVSAAYGLNEYQGWVRLTEEALKDSYPDVKMVNASISGDTTEGGLRRLPAALERFKPDLLILELGGNDALRGYSAKKIATNLETLSTMAQEVGAKVLILGMRIPSNYGPAYTEQFSLAFIEAATKTGASLVPFFLEPIATNRDYFQRDGIHPTAEAQPILMEHVLGYLKPLLDELQ